MSCQAHQAPEPAGEQARRPRRAIARRRFLQVFGGLGLAAGISYLAGRRVAPHPAAPGVAPPEPPAGAAAAATPDSLDRLAHSIRHGAPGPDAIPSIDHPQFVPAARARFLADEDVVFGLVRAGQARAYPQLVLVWHEIVNDRFPDGPLSVTYCPLTGSALALRGVAPSGEPYTLGPPATWSTPICSCTTGRPTAAGRNSSARPSSGPAAGGCSSRCPCPWSGPGGGAGGRPTRPGDGAAARRAGGAQRRRRAAGVAGEPGLPAAGPARPTRRPPAVADRGHLLRPHPGAGARRAVHPRAALRSATGCSPSPWPQPRPRWPGARSRPPAPD